MPSSSADDARKQLETGWAEYRGLPSGKGTDMQYRGGWPVPGRAGAEYEQPGGMRRLAQDYENSVSPNQGQAGYDEARGSIRRHSSSIRGDRRVSARSVAAALPRIARAAGCWRP